MLNQKSICLAILARPPAQLSVWTFGFTRNNLARRARGTGTEIGERRTVSTVQSQSPLCDLRTIPQYQKAQLPARQSGDIARGDSIVSGQCLGILAFRGAERGGGRWGGADFLFRFTLYRVCCECGTDGLAAMIPMAGLGDGLGDGLEDGLGEIRAR